MRALLIVAHGSRRSASNDEVRALARQVKQLASPHFDQVRAAFLELAEPSIPEGIQACIDDGANEVVVMPYFLSAGRHVSQDIPEAVARKQEEHPHIDIHISRYLGADPGIATLILQSAEDSADDMTRHKA